MFSINFYINKDFLPRKNVIDIFTKIYSLLGFLD